MWQWLRKVFDPKERRDARGRWVSNGVLTTKVMVRGTATRAQWKKVVGMSPKQYFGELLNGTGLKVGVLRVSRTKTGGDKLKYVATLETPNGSHAGWLERTFYTNEEGATGVEHHNFMLERALQGRGIAKQVMRNALSQYGRMGVAEVTTQAARSAGGAVWPKFGFLSPNRESWVLLRNQLSRRVDSRLPAAAQSGYHKLLASDDPHALWAVADSKYGTHLLAGTNYFAQLNLGDARQMRRMRAYIKR